MHNSVSQKPSQFTTLHEHLKHGKYVVFDLSTVISNFLNIHCTFSQKYYMLVFFLVAIMYSGYTYNTAQKNKTAEFYRVGSQGNARTKCSLHLSADTAARFAIPVSIFIYSTRI
jgi:hypothetical protein